MRFVRITFFATIVMGIFFNSAPLILADYDASIIVNTSAYSGTSGQVDLQFNPEGGNGVLTASVSLNASDLTTWTGLSSFGIAPTPNPLGSVTPTSYPGFPYVFTADNTNGPQTNEVTFDVTYGSTLALDIHVVTSTTDSTSAASFFAGLFDNSGNLLFNNNTGSPSSVQIDFLSDGSSPVVTPAPGVTVTIPEPVSIVLLVQGIACVSGGIAVYRRFPTDSSQSLVE